MKKAPSSTASKALPSYTTFDVDEVAIPMVTPYSLLCGLVRIAARLYDADAAAMWSAERNGRGALVAFYGLSDEDATALDIDAYSQTVGDVPIHLPDSGQLLIVADVTGGLYLNRTTHEGCRIVLLNKEPIPVDERLEGIVRTLADQATALIGLPRREVITRTNVQRVQPPPTLGIDGGEIVADEPYEGSVDSYGFLTIFKSHPLPAFVIDRATLNILEVNDAVITQYGYERDEIVGMNLRALRPPEDVARLEAAVAHDTERSSRWTHIKKNGENIIVQIDRTDVVFAGRDCFMSTAQDITARVAMEEALKASQERFRLVTENISDMIIMIDHDGNVRYVSPASSRLLGSSPEDLVGSSFIERIHPEDEARVIDAILEGFVAAGVSKPIEFRMQHACGEWRRFEAVANNQFDTPGLESIVVAVRDITRQERDASQLRVRERALEAVSTGVVIVDTNRPDWPVIYANRAFERITGYSAEEVMGRNLRFLHAADKDQPDLLRFREAIKHGRETTVVLRNFRKDGREFWNELHISPIFDDQGSLSHYVGVQTDITERKQIIESLTETEERYRVLVGGSSQIVWVANANGDDIAALSPGSPFSLSQRAAWLEQVHPEDIDVVERAWRDALASRVARECEHRVRREGEYRTVVSKAIPLLDSSGNVREWICMSVDVTQQRKVQTRVVQKMKLAALGELIAGVASEISRPLDAIACAARLLEIHGDPKVVKTGSMMLGLTRRIDTIVESLTIFARHGDEGRIEANLNHAILSILGVVRFDLKRAGVDIELDLDDSLPNTQLNVDQIEKVVLNLIENAIDALQPVDTGKRMIRIATGTDTLSDGRRCIFAAVTDTGIGIDSESIGSIYDPFYTTKGGSDSVGLGLSICHGVMRAHGGSIDVESSLGHGATFILKLPIEGAESESNAIAPPLAA